MANRVFYPMMSAGQNRVILAGSWYPNGTNPITISDGVTAPKHFGFTVSRTAVGTYTVVLLDKYFAVLDINANLVQSTPTNQTIKISSVPRPQATYPNTITVIAWDPTLSTGTGGAFDPAQSLPGATTTGTLITFSCLMKISNIGQAI